MATQTQTESSTPWPRAPVHQLSESGAYLVTAATFNKAHHFRGADRLSVLQRGLLKVTAAHGWDLEAWAMFSNHYHFVGRPPESRSAEDMSLMLAKLHNKMAQWVNRLDGMPGRKVWHNFWETRLTFQRSYLARLNYVHHNPVKHGLVQAPNQYPWSSARWFERVASAATVKSIYRFKWDTIPVNDGFEVDRAW